MEGGTKNLRYMQVKGTIFLLKTKKWEYADVCIL